MAKGLREKVIAEEERLSSLRKKKTEIEEKIEKTEEEIKRLTILANSESYEELKETADDRGLSLDEVITALKNGNFILNKKEEEDGLPISTDDTGETGSAGTGEEGSWNERGW